MTIVELRALIKELGLDDNGKLCLLIAKAGEDNYQVVACDETGKLITTSS